MGYETKKIGFFIEAYVLFQNIKESINISKNINNILIEKNFLDNNMPLWTVNMTIPYNIKQKLQEENTYLSIKIYTTHKELEKPTFDINESRTYDKLVYDVLIKEYMKDYTQVKPFVDDEQQNKQQSIKYTITGIPENIIKTNSVVINKLFKETNTISAIKNIVDELDSNLDIEFSENFDNKKHNFILLPPMNFIMGIKHLLKHYQPYNSRNIFFIDHDKIYIKHIKGLQGNTITIDVLNKDDEKGYNTEDFGVKIDENNNIKFKTNIVPPIFKYEHIINDEIGSENTYFSYDYFYNLESNVKKDKNNYNKKRIYWNNNKNVKNNEIIEENKKMSTSSIIKLNNIDPTIISPNTTILIKAESENEYCRGRYFISSLTTNLFSQDFENFNSETSLKIINFMNN